MPYASRRKRPDKKAVRDWTLYVIRFSDGSYYIGITAYKDFKRRIRQHGGRMGARWNLGKTVEEIVEVQPLGKMPRVTAENIENDVTLQYRKQYGSAKVRGGYNAWVARSIIPIYTPGSVQSVLFVLACFLLALVLLLIVVLKG